jgi:hypothetical protein
MRLTNNDKTDNKALGEKEFHELTVEEIQQRLNEDEIFLYELNKPNKDQIQ